MRTFSFQEVLNILSSYHKLEGKAEKEECPKILETVFLQKPDLLDLDEKSTYRGENQQNNGPFDDSFSRAQQVYVLDWFYCSSQGNVCRQSKNSLQLKKVYERFCKIVDATVGDEIVAVGRETQVAPNLNSTVEESHLINNVVITKSDFLQEIRFSAEEKGFSSSLFSRLAVIQPSIQRCNLENRSYRVSFRATENNPKHVNSCYIQPINSQNFLNFGSNRIQITSLHQDPIVTASKLPPDFITETVFQSLEKATARLIENFEAAVKKRYPCKSKRRDHHLTFKVQSIVVDYISNTNNFWISNITNVNMGQAKRIQDSHKSTVDALNIEVNPSVLNSVSKIVNLDQETMHKPSDTRSVNSLLMRITNLEVALANERKKNQDNCCIVNDLQKYRDEVNRQLRSMEKILLIHCRDHSNKDVNRSACIEAPENVNIDEFLRHIEFLFRSALEGLRLTKNTDQEELLLPSSTRKNSPVGNIGSLTTAIFHILDLHFQLRKFEAFRYWLTSTALGDSSPYAVTRDMEQSKCIDNVITHDDSLNILLEGKDANGLLATELPTTAEQAHSLSAFHELRETHKRDIKRIECMVEDKVKLAMKRAHQAYHYRHLSTINRLENEYRMKEEAALQRQNQNHHEQMEALKAQQSLDMASLKAHYEKRELEIALNFDDKMRSQLDTVIHSEKELAAKILSATIRECEDRWKDQLEAQSKVHKETLLTLEETNKFNSLSKIERITERIEEERLQWKSEIHHEYLAAQENLIALEKKRHTSELQGLQDEFDFIISESDEKSKALAEAQYQKGLHDNQLIYHQNLEKLQGCANSALEQVKDFARCQYHEFLSQNTTFLRLITPFKQQNYNQHDNHVSADSVLLEKDRTENNYLQVLSKRQEESIESMMTKLQLFKELAWEAVVQQSTAFIHTGSYNTIPTHSYTSKDSTSRDEKTAKMHIINDMTKYINDRAADIRIAIEKEIKNYSDIILEYEEWIQRLEYEAGWMRRQKEMEESSKTRVEAEMERFKQFHAINEDHWRKLVIQSNLEKWLLLSKGLVRVEELKEEISLNDIAHAQTNRIMIEQTDEWKEKMSSRIDTLENSVIDYRERLMKIYDSIIHYKRDTINQQKNHCFDLSSKLNSIKILKGELESKQKLLNEQISYLGDQINEAERRIRDHCRTSVIQDGIVNDAHTVRKRRLDQEYDQLVQTAAVKRNEFISTEIQIKHLTQEKELIEDEMRQLERGLVEILLEQQKIILGLTSM